MCFALDDISVPIQNWYDRWVVVEGRGGMGREGR